MITKAGWKWPEKGVEAFVAHAMARKVSLAMETVFSHWKKLPNGQVQSKVDLIRQMQKNGYYVLLLFVGLSDYQLSKARVYTRYLSGGHNVDDAKLSSRFPRTQKAIRHAINVVDASILTDNSRGRQQAFTVCRVQIGNKEFYDCRDIPGRPKAILNWLNIVNPRATKGQKDRNPKTGAAAK